MNNNHNDNLDYMMRQYFGREQEAFTRKASVNKGFYLRLSSAVAAALVILLTAGFLIYSATTPKNDFVISAAAAGTEEYTNLAREHTDFSVRTFYTVKVDPSYVAPSELSKPITAGIIVVQGNTVTDFEACSLYQEGEFLKASEDGFYSLDSQGNEKDYGDTSDGKWYVICSLEEISDAEKKSAIWYIPVDDEGNPIDNEQYIAEEKRDTILLKVYFEDGSCKTQNVYITYNEGRMNLSVERWD